ncbi:TagK domain-containing protein [Burkholderia pseudomallei]|uniref:TagK domain-containing protein n=1 Tax=Burkholderia pseudomallei TaxID=28450 RepID=UPI00106544FF|nr:TagK domain-containing protein [Burkholderia pseudomallei]QBP47136.1 TagK domain-containing protein [Burkholderia pseudomallei]QBP67048.1 TagK domain-containing protein [Burkholderia pseudomallei]QBR22518.1 TagK domain-containing protein [Burkholderia pseudomallei]
MIFFRIELIMRAFKLFRRGPPDIERAETAARRDFEPSCAGVDMEGNAGDETGACLAEAQPPRAPQAGPQGATDGGDAVFGVIGAAFAADTPGERQGGTAAGASAVCGTVAAQDLLHTLYEQYCRVLDDPRASLASDDAARLAIERTRDAGPQIDPQRSADGADSIDALLSRARMLDDAFGTFAPGEAPDPADAEPVPEVLRLFAPAEYHAASARRPAGLPPALARREHQTLAIDSPLPAPVATSEHGA